jgi:hypothetical protein
MDNSKTLFKMLFGEKLFNKLDSTPLKNIDWIDYFSEREGTLLDLYLQTIFHYGYQQCYDKNKNVWENLKFFIET